jgi:hypothetical protein
VRVLNVIIFKMFWDLCFTACSRVDYLMHRRFVFVGGWV